MHRENDPQRDGQKLPSLRETAPDYTRFSHYVQHQLPRLYGSSDRLPYHGWHHIEELLIRATGLLDRLEQHGIHLNYEVTRHAILFHDVLFEVDHVALGVRSKEALSAHYARETLLRFNFSPEHAVQVENAILATHVDACPETIEQIVLRAVDVQGVMADYMQFRADTERLRREAEILSGHSVSEQDFLLGSFRHIAGYFCPVFELTEAARNARGVSLWHQGAASNLLHAYREMDKGEQGVTLTLLSPEARLEGQVSRGLLFDVSGSEELRRARLNESKSWSTDGPVVIPLPLESGLIPLPNSSVDTIIADAQHINVYFELVRVLRHDGVLTFVGREGFEGNFRKILEASCRMEGMSVSDAGDHITARYC